MKKYIYILSVVLSAFVLISCKDFLDSDQYFGDTITYDAVWKNESYTKGWLADAYSNLWGQESQRDIRKEHGGPLWIGDDLIYGDWLDTPWRGLCQYFQNGEYSADQQFDNDTWGANYRVIRLTSEFIMNVDKCVDIEQEERVDLKAQARFLRAYVYYKLIEKYGPVPLLPEEGLDPEASYKDLATPRNTMEECTEFVVSEMAQAALSLPLVRNKTNLQRPTKGAALAMRAKMYNLAASPLYNSEGTPIYSLKDNTGKQLVENAYSEEKWAKAAAAAKEVIDLNAYELFTVKKSKTTVNPPVKAGYSDANFPEGWADIDPYLSYRRLFDGSIHMGQINEIIFGNDNDNSVRPLVEHSIPRYQKGWNTVAVSQKQVDAYQMCDGRDISNSSEEYPYLKKGFYTSEDKLLKDVIVPYPLIGNGNTDVSYMYVNREPRFYASIGFNGSLWEALSVTESKAYQYYHSNFYKGSGRDDKISDNFFYPMTGYTLRKYYFEEDCNVYQGLQGAIIGDKFEPVIRYAEVLLWCAEAENHLTKDWTFDSYDGKSKVSVNRDLSTMHSCIRPIRVRAGLPDFDDYVYDDVKNFNNAIIHERQVEFFAEAKRYFDLNRWLLAEKEQNQPLMGCNMEMNASELQKQRFYEPVQITDMPKSFVTRQYLWPLPTDELRRNDKLTQNPGW